MPNCFPMPGLEPYSEFYAAQIAAELDFLSCKLRLAEMERNSGECL